MTPPLFWDNLHRTVKESLAAANRMCYIAAPFISASSLATVLPDLPSTVITSWRPEHLLSGVSSLTTYDVCRNHGQAALYVHPRLHAKIFAIDLGSSDASAIVGSANVTETALGDSVGHNVEVLAQIHRLDIRDQLQMLSIVNESLLVTQDLHDALKEWLTEVKNGEEKIKIDKFNDILFKHPRRHLITNLPLTDSPIRLWQLAQDTTGLFDWWEEDAMYHDLALYGGDPTVDLNEFIRQTKIRFFQHEFIRLFADSIPPAGIYFGRVKEWLMQNCSDVPTPKRRELTYTVQALYRWFVDLAPADFQIIQPRHSECLRRRGKNQPRHVSYDL